LKYEREILADDSFIQTLPQTQASNTTSKNLTKIGREFANCIKEEKCPCPKEQAKDAKGATNGTAFLQNTTCAMQENSSAASCAQGCSEKVVSLAHSKLDKKKSTKGMKKQVFLEKDGDYPIHSVTVGVFGRGAMNMD